MTQSNLPNRSIHERIQTVWDRRENSRTYIEELLELSSETSQDNPDLATSMLQEACNIAGQHKDGRLIARARTRLAWQAYLRSSLDQALLQASYAQAVAEAAGADDLRSSAVHITALVRARIGDYAEAQRLWLDLIARAVSAGDRGREADYLESLASLYQSQKRLSESLDLRHQAHAIYIALGDANLPTSANNLAQTYLALGRTVEARAWVKQAIEQCNPRNTHLLSIFEHTLGLSHAAGHDADFKAAMATFRRALITLARGTRDLHVEAMIRIDMGMSIDRSGDPAGAIYHIEMALRFADKIRDFEQSQRAHKALHGIYTRMGALQEALKHCDKQVGLIAQGAEARDKALSAVLAACATVITSAPIWRQDIQRAVPTA